MTSSYADRHIFRRPLRALARLFFFHLSFFLLCCTFAMCRFSLHSNCGVEYQLGMSKRQGIWAAFLVGPCPRSVKPPSWPSHRSLSHSVWRFMFQVPRSTTFARAVIAPYSVLHTEHHTWSLLCCLLSLADVSLHLQPPSFHFSLHSPLTTPFAKIDPETKNILPLSSYALAILTAGLIPNPDAAHANL